MKLKQLFSTILMLGLLGGHLNAQVLASFSLSQNSTAGYGWSDAGWTNVFGDPFTGVRTATANGITISSISTSNWVTNNGACAEDAVGASGGTFFPDHILRCHWYQASNSGGAAYNAAVPQLRISGLNKDSSYILRMSSSYAFGAFGDPTQYTVAGQTVEPSQLMYSNNNTATGVTFQHVYPNASGIINVYVNTTAGKNVAYLSGIQIISGSSTVGIPVVSITSPAKNDVVIKGNNITINATATETASSITKVEFFADGTKLGESTTAPYSYTWLSPAAGSHVIVAKATDPAGTTGADTANISVVSLSSFWSLKGNAGAKGDSNFLGTVDTNRLALRTNNQERMSISSKGNIDFHSLTLDSARPAFRVYNNGDLTAGTTMAANVNTARQNGLRYYSKLGILQIGASDRLDTTGDVHVGPYEPTGILMNSDEPNNFKGRIYSSYFSGDESILDSGSAFVWSIASGEHLRLHASLSKVLIMGWNHFITAESNTSLILGLSAEVNKPIFDNAIIGNHQVTLDTSFNSLITGGENRFGGLGQLVAGASLINRTPYGTTLGVSNVDFSSLPLTGLQGTRAPNISQYPLLSIGNATNDGPDNAGPVRSNALTVLFNGRTQINTTGHTNTLSQSDVTPRAALDVVSTNTGVLLPRLSNAQRSAIAGGDLQNGLLLYNTDSSVFQYYNGSAWSSIGGAGQGGRWLFNSGVQYDSLNSVGIGTSNTQGYKLAVKGAALFTRIQVKAIDKWPDYVFDKGYRLRSLEDLESYVRRYKHLPEIITAAKAGAEGVDVATHQAALLKKVEELTLYLIEENKQLKSQNEQLAAQSRQIAEQKVLFEQQQRQIEELKELIKKRQ